LKPGASAPGLLAARRELISRRAVFFWREKEAAMPAKSKAQQQAAGAALSAKRGERTKSSLKGASKEMYESMSEKQLKDFASTKQKGKPKRVSNGR
jgi:hypothetical protein